MKVREVTCKTALSPSRLPGYDYALNPYRGCQHACVYCFAPSVLRELREWGSFVDIKVNLPRVLSQEVKKRRKGVVGISTVTDAYQPIERRYRLTRSCLKLLLKHDFPVVIQTKSSLVLRDLDLIKKFSTAEVGFTITAYDNELAREYEPYASGVEERFGALERIINEGVRTWVFIGPIMPHITDEGYGLEGLISRLADLGVAEVIVDRLNFRRGVREKVMLFIEGHYPELLERYSNLNDSYFDRVKGEIAGLCKENAMKCTLHGD
ncbi:MAG: radical SAM protein [Candidatus Hydrothermarchaeota archaeon]|jgi:DNA repair photolyase|nr:radical SAM protein [Candidatus Hydrothermarchaeota archaeon]